MREMKDGKMIRLKYVVEILGRIGFRGYTEQDLVDENEGAITLSPSNIQNMKMDYSKCSFLTWQKYYESPEIKIKDRDVLFVKTGSTYGKAGYVENLPMEATINPQLVVFKNIKMNSKLLFYMLQMPLVKDQCELAVVGGTIPTMSQVKIGNIYIPSLPLNEQQRIADFLDRECGKIDGLKADIQVQIDTLEQYKRSVITEAVTHGLNPFAPMKDSKVWYGQIPSEWKELKGKYVFKQRNDRGNNVCLQLLSPTQKYGVIPQDKYEELTGMNAVKLNDSTNYALLKTIHKGDYCISLRSFQGGFEYSECEGVVSPAYQVFYPIITIADGYYKYLFKEKGFIDVMNSYTMSLRDGKNIAFDDFGDTFIPVPPLDEQQEIADYLDNKCAEIEQIIADKKSQIETLDGYKKSLIYEYVTGKKEAV